MIGGKEQQQAAHLKRQERRNLRRSTLEKFGRNLLKNVSEIDPDTVNWKSEVDEFIRHWSYDIIAYNRPGLMYLNWVVSKEFGYDAYLVRSNTKVRRITKVKHTAMYLAATLFKYKYDELQEFYNIRNHASIVNAMNVARNYLFTDKEYKQKVEILTNKLLGYNGTDRDYETDEERDTE